MVETGRSWRVLVVEDEPTNREVATTILEAAGHAVCCCENGRDAVELCLDRGECFDVILMDLRMPVMDGHEAIALLRADPRTQDVPIVCVSARSLLPLDRRATVAGVNHVLTKPYRRRDLLTALDAVLKDA